MSPSGSRAGSGTEGRKGRTLPNRPASKIHTRQKKKKPGPNGRWHLWWPLALGILVTPLARRAAGVLAMEGPTALNFLYPYVALLKLHALGLPEELGSDLSQLMVYAQFPMYGLLCSILLRSHKWAAAVFTTALFHVLPVLLLLGLPYLQGGPR